MTILQAVILGLVQGLTEFIPVSSSGHLVLLHEWFGITESGLIFDVALHFGTLMALLIFFYKDIWQLIKGLLGKNDHTKLAWLILLATIPAMIVGFLLEGTAKSAFRSTTLVAASLIIIALFMLAAERYAKKVAHKTKLEYINRKQALTVGIVQALAVIPGVSRSGSTITAGLFMGLDRVTATRFSFLLGVPIMIGALIAILVGDSSLHTIENQAGVFIAGVLAAFISGSLAIRFLLKYLAKHTLDIFAYYRIALGILVLIMAAVG